MVRNNTGDADIIAEIPKAINVVCTIQPDINPAVVARPAFAPFVIPWVRT